MATCIMGAFTLCQHEKRICKANTVFADIYVFFGSKIQNTNINLQLFAIKELASGWIRQNLAAF